jgi:hypothetical protein
MKEKKMMGGELEQGAKEQEKKVEKEKRRKRGKGRIFFEI